MFIFRFLLIFLGLGLLFFGLLFIGFITKGSFYVFMNIDDKNDREKVFKTLCLGGILIGFGLLLLSIYYFFI